MQGNLESAEKCYKRDLCSREKQFDENHPRMVKISVILERLNKKRPQDDKAAGQPSVETDCEKQPVKDQSDEQISLQLESLDMQRLTNMYSLKYISRFGSGNHRCDDLGKISLSLVW